MSSKKEEPRYKKLEKLGEGTYGVVYKAIDQKTHECVAIKKIKLDHSDEGIPATTLREISMLKQLKHECIVQLKHAEYGEEGRLFLIFEFVEQDMKSYMEALTDALDSRTIKRFMYQLVCGLHHCHRKRILHRDLKPQNILIGEDGSLKIADFGLGREHGIPIEAFTHEVVTLWYRSPEILLGAERYSGAVDVWSVGCIFAEFYKREAIFMGDCEIDQLFQIFQTLGTPTEILWPGVTSLKDFRPVFPKWTPKSLDEIVPNMEPLGHELLNSCFTYQPGQRMTAVKIKKHAYFAEVASEFNFD